MFERRTVHYLWTYAILDQVKAVLQQCVQDFITSDILFRFIILTILLQRHISHRGKHGF